MISSFPSYDEELFNSAYANISLIADKAWSFDKEDPFQKFNRSLWIEYRKVAAKYKENVNRRAKRVRDVIPESRLASYGNYEYDEERENLYKSSTDDDATSAPLPNFCWTEVTESWMLPDVQKYFGWLTSNGSRSNRESSTATVPEADHVPNIVAPQWDDRLRATRNKFRSTHVSDDESSQRTTSIESNVGKEHYPHRRYTIENCMEMQLHVRVTSEAIRNLWKFPGNGQQHCSRLQQAREQNSRGKERPQQFCYAFRYRPLVLRTEYQTAHPESQFSDYGTIRKHLPAVLSPEVAEFFPKVATMRFDDNREQNANRVQYFPSLDETTYQNELFPYNRTRENVGTAFHQNTGVPLVAATDTTMFIGHPHQWYQRIPAPVQIQSSTGSSLSCSSIQPLRATSVARYPVQLRDNIREKFLQPKPVSIPVYQHPVELYRDTGQKRKNHGVDFKNLILLTKNAMKAHRGQSKEPHQKPTYILETRNRASKTESEVFRWNVDGKADRKASGSRREKDETENKERPKTERSSNEKKDQSEIRNRRRLYRDVLTNASVNQAMFENVFEKRYDELEKQAMEQYRSSEESLALKYQELERQALEQYKCCENLQEDYSMDSERFDGDSTTSRNLENTNCFDGQNCSGFRRCSPLNARVKNERGCSVEKQTNVAGTASKSESDNSEGTLRDTTVYSKSFTALSRKLSYGSKNASKGASANNTDKRGRHFMKMSTFQLPYICARIKYTYRVLARRKFEKIDRMKRRPIRFSNLSKIYLLSIVRRIVAVSVRTSSKRRLIPMSPFEKESEAKLTKTPDLDEFYCIARGNKTIFGCYNRSKVGRIGGGDENIAFMESPVTEGIYRFADKLIENNNFVQYTYVYAL
ncbi:uncharacterized protein LOC105663958 isoform X1 [Megachile rotundata]|uniref:uncharacterized protein LOC105663958 isoform X1 n=1 Tax=Megachile rotundata TaxID=143995 RepID=UPI003FD0B037